MTRKPKITRLTPRGRMDILSRLEVNQLKQGSADDTLYETFRRCALAVLNVDSQTDDAREVLEQYRDFDIRVIQQERGHTDDTLTIPCDRAAADRHMPGETAQH